jgi:hypothetical protein
MASTGAVAWRKHFAGKGNIETTMKKASPLLDADFRSVGKVQAGQKILFLETAEYQDKTPIKIGEDVYYVTFNAVQKPLGKGVSGIKLKPQDFSFFTREGWGAKELAEELISEVEERADLEPDLKNYLIAITKYWAKIGRVTTSDLNALPVPAKGIAEINKDYGEMLGAIACIKHKILQPNVRLTNGAKLNFPLRGNEPLVDYYVIDGKKKYSISAKSGTTTNTLKPGDVKKLLEAKGEWSSWARKSIGKMVDCIVSTSTFQFPFQFINTMYPGTLSKEALKIASGWTIRDVAKKNYDQVQFAKLIKLIDVPNKSVTKLPTVGELFYYTEKCIIEGANNKPAYNPTDMFVQATASNVMYVKYLISAGKPQGDFEIMIPDANKVSEQKKIKWRSKNSTARAADKLGMQP